MSRIDARFLLNGITSEMKQYAIMNLHMTFLDSGSTETVVRKASVLLDVRQVENELLLFWNHSGAII